MEYIKPIFLLLFVLGIVASVSSRHAAKHYPVEDAGNQDESSLVKKTLKGQGSSLTSAFDNGEEKNKRKVSVLRGLVERKVIITIDNESGFEWKYPSTYFFLGVADEKLPSSVPEGEKVQFKPRKKDLYLYGTAGVLTYYIKSKGKTLAVMWSDPYYDFAYGFWWNVKLYDGKKTADKKMYKELNSKKESRFEAGDNYDRELGSDLSASGYMSNSGIATLDIEVYPTETSLLV